MMERVDLAPLVLRAKAGDQNAWGDLYEKTVREAYFVARKVCGNEDEAADLVQEAYLTAWQRLDQLESPEKFQSWLHMIVANRCRDYLRKKKPLLFTELEQDDGTAPDWADDRDASLPEQRLVHKETVRLVAEIIDGLPEDQRLCLLLYYRDELSVAQIAQALGVSEGTVKSRLNYARKKVKVQVEALEKKGTKLYGLAPLPFLLWLLQGEAEAVALPASLVAVTTAATTTVAGAATAAAAKTATATGTKAILTGVGTKVAAGVTAVGVLAGGVTVYRTAHKAPKEMPSEPAPIVETVELPASIPESISEPEPSQAEQAYAAFESLLEHGIGEDEMMIRYYTYLDLDQDGVPELLAACNSGTEDTWTAGQLYRFQDGKAICVRHLMAWYTAFHLVDGYIWGVNLDHRGCLWGLDEEIIDVSMKEHAEPIELLPNSGGWELSHPVETPCFSVQIPNFWTGKGQTYTVISEEGCECTVYLMEPNEAGHRSAMFQVKTVPVDADLGTMPGAIDYGISEAMGMPLRVIGFHPQDAWYEPGTDDPWQQMLIDVPWVLDNVVIK